MSKQLVLTPSEFVEYIFEYLHYNGKFLNRVYNEIIVHGSVSLIQTMVKSLPDNLTIRGDLNLGYCFSLSELPNNLIVNGALNIKRTPIKSLPENIRVDGNFYIGNTPFAKNLDLVHKFKDQGLNFIG